MNAEQNTIIAEFMGLTKTSYGWLQSFDWNGGVAVHPDALQFHESWDWLMPVVEKIAENYDFTIQFYSGDCNCYCMKQTAEASEIPEVGHGGFKPNIESVYKSVVAFVKWYAKNKPLKY